MQSFFNIWNRVRKFDPSTLTPMQIIVGIAGGIVALWVIAQALSFILNILFWLMVPALAVVVGYFIWTMMKSRSEDIPAEMKKTEQEKTVEEAIANVKAALSAEQPDEETQSSETTVAEVEEEEVPLAIAQVVNPETGFKEPDISRLIEHEEEKLKEADKVNDEILSQIEARRKRLLGKDGK